MSFTCEGSLFGTQPRVSVAPQASMSSSTTGKVAIDYLFSSQISAASSASPTLDSLSESDAGDSSEQEENVLARLMENSELHDESIIVDKNVFYNDNTLRYMRILDTYKKLELSKEIELPRLVLAGDQSCGKSSLLENLTGLPVPITAAIGTRFPIEITLVEDLEIYEVTARIRIDSSFGTLSQLERDSIDAFNNRASFHRPMTSAEFEVLLAQVSKIFGVPPPKFAHDSVHHEDTSAYPRKISRHCLQISMRGKDFKTLSFVDTPGLYHTKNSVQDMGSAAEIESLVEDLVGEERTVIVAVMDASQQYVSQKVFNFADDADPLGKRTIGVLTKCDRVPLDERDALDTTFRIARNEEHPLKHGWFAVKNRSSSEAKNHVSIDQARTKEAVLFSKSPWAPASSGLKEEFMGIESLRNGLSRIFCAHISQEFPAFNEQTKSKLAEKIAQLEALGPQRIEVADQRWYLKSIVKRYQAAKNSSLEDTYSDNSDHPRLQIQLNRCCKGGFRDCLESKGVQRLFCSAASCSFTNADDDTAATITKPSVKQMQNIYTWINVRYQATKTCQIPGLIPYGLLEKLFEEQSSKWNEITTTFIDQVQIVFQEAIEHSIRSSCQNDAIFNAINQLVRCRGEAKFRELRNRCDDLIRHHRIGLQVVGGEEQFVKEVREAKILRIINAVSRSEIQRSVASITAFNNTFLGFSPRKLDTASNGATNTTWATENGSASKMTPWLAGTVPPPTEITPTAKGVFSKDPPPVLKYYDGMDYFRTHRADLKSHLTHERQTIYEIHDILKAYYRISLSQYTDTVCTELLNKDYIGDIMNICCDDLFDSLSDEEIKRIAGESASGRKSRRELNDIIGRLRAAIRDSEAILAEGRNDDF